MKILRDTKENYFDKIYRQKKKLRSMRERNSRLILLQGRQTLTWRGEQMAHKFLFFFKKKGILVIKIEKGFDKGF